MQVTHLFLDADQTLFDFERAERAAFTAICLELSLPHDGQLYQLYSDINARMWALLEQGGITKTALRRERFRLWLEAAGFSADLEALSDGYTRYLGEMAFLFPGAEEFCRAAARKYPLYLATNGIAAVQRGRLARSPLANVFRKVYVSEDLGCEKPSPDFFLRMLADAGAKAENSLMVGDSLRADIAGAQGVGMKACWYDPHSVGAGNAKPDYIVHSYEELYRLLEL